jgi:hypothetical protein
VKNIEDIGNKTTDIIITDFRLSWLLTVDSNSILGSLHRMAIFWRYILPPLSGLKCGRWVTFCAYVGKGKPVPALN